MVNPCRTTSINSNYDATFRTDHVAEKSVTGPLEYPVRWHQPTVEGDMAFFDAISTKHGNETIGHKICGEMQYSITVDGNAVYTNDVDVDVANTYDWLTFTKQVGDIGIPAGYTQGSISISTNDFADVEYTPGGYAIVFKGCL